MQAYLQRPAARNRPAPPESGEAGIERFVRFLFLEDESDQDDNQDDEQDGSDSDVHGRPLSSVKSFPLSHVG
jgi:hypothetical protein